MSDNDSINLFVGIAAIAGAFLGIFLLQPYYLEPVQHPRFAKIGSIH